MDELYLRGASLELKTVDVPHRLISGYAAYHHNIDRVKDIIDPGASAKATRRLATPADVAVFVGHDSSALPVGIPQRIEATPQGLYTETYILKGPAGDNLLSVAKDLMDHGQSLGMSIGYKTHDSRREQAGGKMVRRIMDYELKEYSFAAHQAIANPSALVHAVKARKAMTEGSDGAGGALVPEDDRTKTGMQYRTEQQGGKWLVLCDADDDADEDDNRVVGSYDSEEMANAVAAALRKEAGEPGDTDDDAKTVADEAKAVWSTSYVNNLEDSSFLYVEDGEKDDEGKTVPRSKRHFPVRDAEGKVDLAHVRNAIARVPQSNAPGLDDAKKAALQARARRMLESAGDGKTYDEPAEWKSGAPIAVRALGYQLVDLSDTLAEELKAMVLLGEETKGYMRIRPEMRGKIGDIARQVGHLLEWAKTIDRGEDGKAQVARLQRELALLDI